MIVVTHNGEHVTSIYGAEGVEDRPEAPIMQTLFEVARTYPDALIVWCANELYNILDVDTISKICYHPRIMASYSVNGGQCIGDSIGYLEDTVFLKINRTCLYPTWRMSGDVGAMYGSTLKEFSFISKKSFEYGLNTIAKIGQSQGMLSYSSPQLLKNVEVPFEKKTKASAYQLFSFIFQHYRTQWMWVTLLSFVLFEKKIPLLPFLLGFFRKKMTSMKPSIPELTISETANTTLEMDVIIPTMGRKKYLQDVLEDLVKQTIRPKKVIIVEQNPEENSTTDLDYIANREWPFEIIHRFIHQTGACNARNLALKETTADWVFMADDDIRFSKTLFENVGAFLNTYKVKAVTVSCLQEHEKERFMEILQWNTFGSGCSVVDGTIARETDYNMAFELGYGEDKEYGMQLRNKGVDVLYNPFISLKHIKAPVGGFRKPVVRPWENMPILPKPSPTVMLFRQNNLLRQQLDAYKLSLFLKFYAKQPIKNPIRYYKRMQQGWKNSMLWAKKLDAV